MKKNKFIGLIALLGVLSFILDIAFVHQGTNEAHIDYRLKLFGLLGIAVLNFVAVKLIFSHRLPTYARVAQAFYLFAIAFTVLMRMVYELVIDAEIFYKVYADLRSAVLSPLLIPLIFLFLHAFQRYTGQTGKKV